MTILDVFVGDSDAIMSNERWLISECKFPNGPSLQTTVDCFSLLPTHVRVPWRKMESSVPVCSAEAERG